MIHDGGTAAAHLLIPHLNIHNAVVLWVLHVACTPTEVHLALVGVGHTRGLGVRVTTDDAPDVVHQQEMRVVPDLLVVRRMPERSGTITHAVAATGRPVEVTLTTFEV